MIILRIIKWTFEGIFYSFYSFAIAFKGFLWLRSLKFPFINALIAISFFELLNIYSIFRLNRSIKLFDKIINVIILCSLIYFLNFLYFRYKKRYLVVINKISYFSNFKKKAIYNITLAYIVISFFLFLISYWETL